MESLNGDMAISTAENEGRGTATSAENGKVKSLNGDTAISSAENDSAESLNGDAAISTAENKGRGARNGERQSPLQRMRNGERGTTNRELSAVNSGEDLEGES